MGKRSRRDPQGHQTRSKGRATTGSIRAGGYPLLQRPSGLDGEFGMTVEGDVDQWVRDLRDSTPCHRVVRVTAEGVDWGTEPGPNDAVGYCMDAYRGDDCFQAAIATVCQVPIEQVPDLGLEERLSAGQEPAAIDDWAWTRIERWAEARGLVLKVHEEQPPVYSDWWIGVVCWPGAFNDHCLVMRHDRLVFDPMCGVKPRPGTRTVFSQPSDISYAITFNKEEDNG